MNTDLQLKVELLTDKTRLQEIYDLRVFAWENSSMNQFINRKYFSNGWSDQLDKNAIHWIIEDQGRIIASARICILTNESDLEEDFSNFNLPNARPFAFYSRLVIHPEFRKRGITYLMDQIRIEFIKENNIAFALAWANNKRLDQLYKLGFIRLGALVHKYSNNPKIDVSNALILLSN